MSDSWGDGWGTDSITIGDMSYRIADGSEETVLIGICEIIEDPVALFYSEYAEGSSNNKYFEVFNPSDETVDLADYMFVNCSNGCTEWEYTNLFADGATIAPGGLYMVAHSSADESLTSIACLLYTSPSPRDLSTSRMPSSA